MKLVIIETPYAGEVEKNINYAQRCMFHSLKRNEAPYLSHLLYTQVLDDDISEDRALGIEAGLAWGTRADLTAAYVDNGVSKGMILGIRRALEQNRPIDLRSLIESPDASEQEDRESLLAYLPESLRYVVAESWLRTSPNTAPTTPDHPIIVLGARVAEALAKVGILDVSIEEDGSRAALVIDGVNVFVYAEPSSLNVRVGDSHVALPKHSTSGEVVKEIQRLLFEERLPKVRRVGQR